MTKQEILQFVQANPVFALATCSGGRPFVRNMMVAMMDKRGIIFSSGKAKDVHRQLCENPNVELCFYNSKSEVQVRISGEIKELDDIELKKAIVEKFEFLKPWIEAAGYEVMSNYCLSGGKAVVWTMETNDKPKEYIDL